MALSFPATPTPPDLNSPSTYNARVLDGFTWCFDTMPTYLEGLSAADFFSVQSSITDTTAGRVMTVGAFGLGASATPAITDFTAGLRPGFYRYLEASATGAPGDGSSFFASCVVSQSGGGDTIIAWRNTTNVTSTRAWLGSRTGSTGSFTWVQIGAHGQDADFANLTADTVKPDSYTVATVPSASSKGAGTLIYVTDEIGGATHAASDGTNWRRMSDRAIIS